MNQDVIHVYLMPGMAANPSIFDNISLPENQFQLHKLHWEIPVKNETISNYALRITKKIKHENIVLLGVSFGGILVQEMSRHIALRKLFVVSSVKTKHELPKRFKILKATKAYKLLPTQLASNLDLLAKFSFGDLVKKRIDLYKRFLSVSDKYYLDWSIDQIVNWKQSYCPECMVHIHGEKDNVFPIGNIKNCIPVKNGTHTMIIHRAKWFNENLPAIILE